MDIDDCSAAFRRKEEVVILLVILEQVFGKACRAIGVLEDCEVLLLVAVSIREVDAELHSLDMLGQDLLSRVI